MNNELTGDALSSVRNRQADIARELSRAMFPRLVSVATDGKVGVLANIIVESVADSMRKPEFIEQVISEQVSRIEELGLETATNRRNVNLVRHARFVYLDQRN